MTETTVNPPPTPLLKPRRSLFLHITAERCQRLRCTQTTQTGRIDVGWKPAGSQIRRQKQIHKVHYHRPCAAEVLGTGHYHMLVRCGTSHT